MLRTCVLGCAMAGALGLAAGCNLGSDAKNPKPGTAQADREEAEKAMRARLDEMDRKLDDLKARAEKATGEEKARLEAKWRESAGKRDAVAKKCEKLKAAATEKWDAAKTEVEHAFSELKKAIE